MPHVHPSKERACKPWGSALLLREQHWRRFALGNSTQQKPFPPYLEPCPACKQQLHTLRCGSMLRSQLPAMVTCAIQEEQEVRTAGVATHSTPRSVRNSVQWHPQNAPPNAAAGPAQSVVPRASSFSFPSARRLQAASSAQTSLVHSPQASSPMQSRLTSARSSRSLTSFSFTSFSSPRPPLVRAEATGGAGKGDVDDEGAGLCCAVQRGGHGPAWQSIFAQAAARSSRVHARGTPCLS